MDALQKITESCMKNELPSFEVGDTVRVQVKIKEGDKERLQAFEGTVIGIKKRRHQFHLHRSPYLSRLRRREGFPDALPERCGSYRYQKR